MKQSAILFIFVIFSMCMQFDTHIWSSVLLPTLARAIHAAHPRAITSAVPAEQEHTTVLVLDMSSSMQKNDPDNLRCSAANAYIALSDQHDSIGVVDLENDNNTRERSSHHFQEAMIWNSPMAMDTQQARQGLQQSITMKSSECQLRNGTTPTYDALSKVLNMLRTSSKEGRSSSVILVTGGEPTDSVHMPDIKQEMAIQSDLLPQFQAHNWPIDIIALSAAPSVLSFLSNLANTTSGKLYTDSDSVVSGVSPLNIRPFLVDIFARHHNSSNGFSVDPFPLDNGGYMDKFQVSDHTDELDVIVVTEQPGTPVELRTPRGRVLSSQTVNTDPYVDIETDPYYTIFIISGPSVGDWRLNISGQQGRFLINAFTLSALQVSLISPDAQTSELPLGQPFTISATISSQDGLQDSLHVNASVTYVGGSDQTQVVSAGIRLKESASSLGMYQGSVSVPENAPSGSYEVIISVLGATGTIIAKTRRIIRLERFPSPFFVNQQNQPTASDVSYAVDELDPFLQWLYSFPPFVTVSRWWPLSNLQAPASISLPCQIKLQEKLYSGATVMAVVTQAGSTSTLPIRVMNDDHGHVQILLLPQTSAGVYYVDFRISGTFADSHYDFNRIRRTVHLIRPVSHAFTWVLLLLFLLLLLSLILLFLLVRFLLISHPFGESECTISSRVHAHYAFQDARYSGLRWFFCSHTLKSARVCLQNSKNECMPAGLKFRFRRRHIFGRRFIEVRSVKKREDRRWGSADGEGYPLESKKFREISELEYQSNDMKTFTIEVPHQERIIR